MSDEDFLRRVNDNEIAFSKGDILICDVRIVTRQDDKGNLKAEYFVEHIVDHRRPSRGHEVLLKNFDPSKKP